MGTASRKTQKIAPNHQSRPSRGGGVREIVSHGPGAASARCGGPTHQAVALAWERFGAVLRPMGSPWPWRRHLFKSLWEAVQLRAARGLCSRWMVWFLT